MTLNVWLTIYLAGVIVWMVACGIVDRDAEAPLGLVWPITLAFWLPYAIGKAVRALFTRRAS